MEFTGERIVPGKVNTDLLNEHLCRYRFAEFLVENKVVLDIGSGVGYGSQILAAKASSVIAVDLSEEAVRYAGKEYPGNNIHMVAGDGHDLPLASDSVDVVVSFELIEHLRRQKDHLLELGRVLRPNGFVIISTPNRTFYTQESNQVNPFHTHEFDFQEYVSFLKSTFGCVRLYFQNHIGALFIGNPVLVQAVTTRLQGQVHELEATSNYFVAVCSHDEKNQPSVGNFCLLPSTGNLLRERQQNIQRLEEEVGKLDSVLTRLQGEYDERTHWSLQLEQRIKELDEIIKSLNEEFEDRNRWAQDLSRQLEEKNEALVNLQSEFEDRNRWAQDLSRQVEDKDKVLLDLRTEFEERTAWAQELSHRLEEKDQVLLDLRVEFEDRNRWAQDLSRQVEDKDKVLLDLRTEFEERTAWAQELSHRLEEKDQVLLDLRVEFEDRNRWAQDLSRQVEEKDKVLLDLRTEFEDRNRLGSGPVPPIGRKGPSASGPSG